MLTGCVSPTSSVHSNLPSETNTEMVTILFSDPASYDKEHTYYDALLELQNNYPDQITSFQIIEADDKDPIKQFAVETFPTMLIIQGDNIHLRMEGNHVKEDIVAKLQQTFRLHQGTDDPSNYHINKQG